MTNDKAREDEETETTQSEFELTVLPQNASINDPASLKQHQVLLHLTVLTMSSRQILLQHLLLNL